LGILFKTHKEKTVELSTLLYSQILPNVLQENLSAKMHKFGIFLIDDMVEHLGFSLLSDKWSSFAQALQMYACSKVCYVRQAASYGIGVFSCNTPSNEFKPYAEALLKALVDCHNIPKGDEKEKVYGHAKDNAISSIGKIIKN